MTDPLSEAVGVQVGDGHATIPVRNLWLLYLFASDLYESLHVEERIRAERNPERLPELAALILCREGQRRLRRNLSVGYVGRHELVSAVRDRIDHLGTTRGGHLHRGKVLCNFTELTVDTPRNRYVAAALALAGRWFLSAPAGVDVGRECLKVSAQFERAGVVVGRPDPATPRRETFGHYDRDDRRLLLAAQLVVDALIPSQASGTARVLALDYSDRVLRDLFEKAVRNLLRVHLPSWRPRVARMTWPSDGVLDPLFPGMKTDVTLDRPDGSRLIVDTKFTSALDAPSSHYGQRLKSAHLYQLYAYLRTQEDRGDLSAERAAGLLVYPSTHGSPAVDVSERMHGHVLRCATVDLAGEPQAIRTRILELVSAQVNDG